MVSYTSFFTLSKELENNGFEVKSPTLVEGTEYPEEDLRATLENILSCVQTLDDYRCLVDILVEMRDRITLYFLYIFYQALASVEERVWASEGMNPPVRELIDSNIDLLLDEYAEYVYILEKGLVDWTKENGFFDDPEKYAFIKERNKIYADYSVLAGEVIDANT